MATENTTSNIDSLDVSKYDEFVGKLSDADLKELANKICEILQKNPDYSSLEDNNTAGTKTKRDRVLEETQEILNSMLRVANIAHKDGLEENLRYKVPALRFSDLKKLSFEDKKGEIFGLAQKLWDDYKIKIKLIKDIDSFDVTKDKYVIEITDNNNNRVTIDYLEYQKKIYDFTVDEEQLLQDEIVKLRGTYDSDVVEAAKEAAKYISLCLAFNEMLIYKYKYIGWQTIYHSKKNYLQDYEKDKERVGEDFKINLINNFLATNHKDDYGLYDNIRIALHINDENLETKYREGKKELVFKYDRLYARGENRERIGFCGEGWANSIGAELSEVDEEEKKFAFNMFFAHTFNNSTKASLILCSAVSGIIRQMLDLSKEYGLNINIIGAAASGKSTLQNLVLSFFGDPTNLASSFLDTEAAKEEERVARVVIPYIIDDKLLDSIETSDNKRGADAFLDVFREYEGRLKQKSGLKNDNSHRFHGAIISSSVESIFELIKKSKIRNNDLGQVRRLIEIKIKKGDIFKDIKEGKNIIQSASKQAETATDLGRRYYGYGVPQVIDYMFLMMKYQSLYHLFLSFKVTVKDTFYLVDKIIKIMEVDTENDSPEVNMESLLKNLEDEFKDKKIDARLFNIVQYIISNKITFGMDENDNRIFRRLLMVTESEMEDEIRNYEHGKYADNMMPSKQRFSLIVLVGYIINYAISYTQFKDFGNVSMNMNIYEVSKMLMDNLKEKLDSHEAVGASEESFIQLLDKRPTVQDVINIYDWLIKNQKYFYIDEVGSSQNVNKNNINNFIGRIQVEDGVGLKLALHSTSEIKVINTVFECDNNPEIILKYIECVKKKGDCKGIACKFVKDTYIEGLLEKNSNLVRMLGNKGKNITINKQGGRGVEIVFDIDAIEEARKNLEQQTEVEGKSAETTKVINEQSQEVVEKQVEETSQEEQTNETN